MNLYLEAEGKGKKTAKIGGDQAIVVNLSSKGKPDIRLLYTGGGKLQVFDENNELLVNINKNGK